MKKGGVIIFFCLAFSVLLATLVYAQGYGTENALTYAKNALVPVISALFGGSIDYLFEKLLFFFVLIVFIFAVLSRFPLFEGKMTIMWIITLAVSILSTRFLTEIEWVQTVLLPYHVLGISLLSLIPFFIFFYFIEKGIESSALRRIAWCLYAVVFIGIWWQRYSEIGKPAWIFFAAAILALIVMLFDNTIQGMFVRSAISQGLSIDRVREIVRLQKELREDYGLLASAHGDQRRKLLKNIADKEKTIKALSKRPY